MQYSLHGSIAIVTGASRKIGIGAAIARALAEIGADLFITYYRPYDATMPWGSAVQEAEALIDELRTMGVRAAGMELDLAQPDAASQLFDSVEKLLGPADILVNNATNSERDGVEALTADLLDRHYAVNVRGMMLLCAEFVRRFHKTEGGRIINMSSGQGVGPMPATRSLYNGLRDECELPIVLLSTEGQTCDFLMRL